MKTSKKFMSYSLCASMLFAGNACAIDPVTLFATYKGAAAIGAGSLVVASWVKRHYEKWEARTHIGLNVDRQRDFLCDDKSLEIRRTNHNPLLTEAEIKAGAPVGYAGLGLPTAGNQYVKAMQQSTARNRKFMDMAFTVDAHHPDQENFTLNRLNTRDLARDEIMPWGADDARVCSWSGHCIDGKPGAAIADKMYKGVPGNAFFKFWLPWCVHTPDMLIKKGEEATGDCYSPFERTNREPNMVPDPKDPKKKITANELLKRAGKTDAIITGVALDVCVLGAAKKFQGFSHLVLNGTRAIADIGALSAEHAGSRAFQVAYENAFREASEKEKESVHLDPAVLRAYDMAKVHWNNAIASFKELNDQVDSTTGAKMTHFYYDKSLNDGSKKEDYITFAKNAGLILFEVENQQKILQFRQGRIPAYAKALHVPAGVTLNRAKASFWEWLKFKTIGK